MTKSAKKVKQGEIKLEKICIMGLGYIGLPTASLLANKGFSVLGVDVKESVVQTINQGKIHIVEPDLDLLVKAAVNSGNLKAALQPDKADIFIVAVPTPIEAAKEPDLSYVRAATQAIVPFLEKGNIVILESTSPVGTCQNVMLPIIEESGLKVGADIYLAHCPERVLPGRILYEAVQNDRIIGGFDKKSSQMTADFYRKFVSGNIYLTDCGTAEFVKLVENSSRDVGIAFANELSIICDKLHLNVWEVIKLANKHPRVNILNPGPGVGGHCIAVDPWFIVASVPQQAKLIRMAREVNLSKPQWVVEKVKQKAERFKDPVVGCLGATYKNDIDDIRESPALLILQELKTSGIQNLMVCEPNIPETQIAGVENCSLAAILEKADILVILVGHQAFKDISPEIIKDKVVIDTCGVFS